MGIFDAINVANGAMNVHRFRTEVAAENVANVYTPGFKRRVVDLRATNFTSTLDDATAGHGKRSAVAISGSSDATEGAVKVARVRTVGDGPYDERQQALLATTDLMQAKSAYELNVRSATLLKSMALASLEIGRGS